MRTSHVVPRQAALGMKKSRRSLGLWLAGLRAQSGGNNGQSRFRQPTVAGFSAPMQSWWMARLQSQHQSPPITWVSSPFSTTTTARAEPQPQHISRNWLASGSGRNWGTLCIIK